MKKIWISVLAIATILIGWNCSQPKPKPLGLLTATGVSFHATPATFETIRQQARAGDTVWMAEGRYPHPRPGPKSASEPNDGYKAYDFTTSGTTNSPIIFRAERGKRVTIDGLDSRLEDIVSLSCSNVWLWGLEIYSSDVLRTERTDPNGNTSFPSPQEVRRGTGINVNQNVTTTGNKIINCYVHDCFVGIGSTSVNALDFEAYGNILVNNGFNSTIDRPHGHNIYAQNYLGHRLLFEANITSGAYENEVQAYGGDGTKKNTDDFEYYKNIFLAGGDGRCLLIGGATLAENARVIDNYTFQFQPNRNLDAGWVEYGAGMKNLTMTGNWFIGGGMYWQPPISGTVTGNTFYAPAGITGPGQYPNNNYISDIPNKVVIIPNKYEPGRANIMIYNGAGASSVFTTLPIPVGTKYTIQDAQNFYGPAIASGTYGGSQIGIKMSGRIAVQPTGGDSQNPARLASLYAGAFVLLSDAGETPVDPPPPPPPVGAKFRKLMYWHHSVGGVIWERYPQYSNLPNSTTIPIEIAKYNTAHNLTGADAVSATEAYGPQTQSQNDNNWNRWARIFQGQDADNSLSSILSAPIVNVKTCYIQQQSMTSASDIAVLQGHIRTIVGVMKQHPENFFILWNNYPAPTDGASSRAVWSAQFSVWMKDVLAKESTFPKNVYIYDVFRKLADPVTGVCPSKYGSGDEGPQGDHPSNEAVSILAPSYVNEVFNAAIAYETGRTDTVITPPPPPPPPPSGNFKIGDTIAVVAAVGNYNIRSSPNSSDGSNIIRTVPQSYAGVIVGGPTPDLKPGSNYIFWRIRWADNTVAWFVEKYMVKTSTLPPPPPPPPPVVTDSVRIVRQGINIGWLQGVAKFDSVRSYGFSQGLLAAPPCPPRDTLGESLHQILKPWLKTP